MTDHNDEMRPARDIARLIEIMAALRTPVTGCPWDLEQTFKTIAPYTIEEAFEVSDAIERGDMLDLREELGDLLLQVVYHAQLAAEEKAFDFGDVVHGITRKMIRRHPHVFGRDRGATSEQAKATWEEIKADERAEKAAERARFGSALPAAAPTPSVLANIPASQPALTRAVKLQDRAARVGFDWPSLAPVFDKVREEIAELEEVALPADPRGATSVKAGPDLVQRVEEELGDLLFVVANVARHLEIDPEHALRRANAKFTRRFEAIETKLAARGKTPGDSDLAEMDALWNEAKQDEKRD